MMRCVWCQACRSIARTARSPCCMRWSAGLSVDAFVVYTDSETWAGRIHPVQALRQYRAQTGIAARLVVVGWNIQMQVTIRRS